jgi:hypothetical protein
MADCLNNCLWHLANGVPFGPVRLQLDGLIDLLDGLWRDTPPEVEGPGD